MQKGFKNKHPCDILFIKSEKYVRILFVAKNENLEMITCLLLKYTKGYGAG